MSHPPRVMTSSDLMRWTEVPSPFYFIDEQFVVQVVDEDLYVFPYPLECFLLSGFRSSFLSFFLPFILPFFIFCFVFDFVAQNQDIPTQVT